MDREDERTGGDFDPIAVATAILSASPGDVAACGRLLGVAPRTTAEGPRHRRECRRLVVIKSREHSK